MDKFVRVEVIKEIKGSQYGAQLEGSVRDGLVAVDKYEDEEEEALEQVVQFFQPKYFKKASILTFYFPASSATAEVINHHVLQIKLLNNTKDPRFGLN